MKNITTNKQLIVAYLHLLEQGNASEMFALFTNDAVIVSPLFGKQPADQFYTNLFRQTSHSTIITHRIFESSDDWMAAHFTYQWALANGQEVAFECVDLFKINNRISELRIIYDASRTRKAVEH
mgnify:CR=1 FL=1